ncbi:hypothetical protein QWZ13_00635 [Reinekea marina]|nr:hypothetical protein [Reinekea marina]MDN3647409.1 hypothetical protein [Reinekea marina]
MPTFGRNPSESIIPFSSHVLSFERPFYSSDEYPLFHKRLKSAIPVNLTL